MKKLLALIMCLLLALTMVACGGKSLGTEDEESSYHEGEIGQTMETYFFDFTVTSAYISDSYSDYVADDGEAFLVLNVTVKNTWDKDITMYDTDFQVQWGDDAEDAFCYPITAEYSDGLVDALRQLPEEYELSKGKSRSGELVFMVPSGHSEYTVSYQELFDTTDGETKEGDVFFVYFVPDEA